MFKKNKISCYILVHAPNYLFIYLESPCSLCFFFLKKETRNHTERKKDKRISYKEQLNRLRTFKLEKNTTKKSPQKSYV